jgi:3-oxoacyl-[acyl-carrier-protein] synthase III
MNGLKKRASPDRSKINMHEPREVKYWAKELGVTAERLQEVVDKVGNAAATVRKELAR